MSDEARPARGANARVDRVVNGLAAWLARHWLALFNVILVVYLGLPILAPVLMEAGATGPARLIYKIYAPTCHQLPERSFFLFGPQPVYTASELEADGVYPAASNLLTHLLLRWNGDATHGHKIALCQRDLALFGSLLASGLLFGALRGLLRRRAGGYAKLPIWLFVLLLAPMALDGGSQLIGLRESNWLLRLITGTLAGSAIVWLAYPYVQEAMEGVLHPEPRPAASAASQTGQNGSVEV